MNAPTFDESQRPVRVTELDYTAFDDDTDTERLRQCYAVSEWFRCRYEWTLHSRPHHSMMASGGKESLLLVLRHRVAAPSLYARPKKFRVTCIHFTYEKAAITRL
jgi:hypothetical protein